MSRASLARRRCDFVFARHGACTGHWLMTARVRLFVLCLHGAFALGCPAANDEETNDVTDTAAATETAEATDDAAPEVGCMNPTVRPQPDPAATPSGFLECGDGLVHRAEAVDCQLGDWAAGDCTSTEASAPCREDSECTQNAGGYCLDRSEPSETCGCAYACTSDADCDANSVCYCDGARSTCIAAACRGDEDCPGDSLCALDEVLGACGSISRSLQCTTQEDECRVDEDCDACLQCLGGSDGSPRKCSGSTGVCGPCG